MIKVTKVIAIEDHYNRRKIREVVKIDKHPQTFNMDDVLILNKSWKPILHNLKDKTSIDNKRKPYFNTHHVNC